MFINYLKFTIRNISRSKGYSFINIFGLAVAMSVCIIIFLWVQYQFSYDKFNENIDDLYWVATWYKLGQDVSANYGGPPAVGPALKEDFPEIIRTTRYYRPSQMLVKYGDKHFRETMRGVDADYLEMFTFPLIHGDAATALLDPRSIVISESIVEKYFGEENPMGKILTIENQYDFKVTGVMRDIPDNSTIGTNIIFPVTFARDLSSEKYIDTWYNCSFYTFAQLREGTDYEELNEKIKGFIKRYDPDTNLDSYLFPYKRIHLHWIGGQGGLIETVKLFSVIALLILLIATINFVNLMTARAGKRAMEIGMRKVVGASRIELIKQFYCESVLHSLAAALIAIGLVESMLPYFRQLIDEPLTMNYSDNLVMPAGLICIVLFTAALSGSYPALLMSSFKPVKALNQSSLIQTKRSGFRKSLVVFQFLISIVLIICTMVIFRQISFITDKYLGFDKEHLVYMRINPDVNQLYKPLKDDLLSSPYILNVTRATHSPSGIYWNGEGWDWEGKDPNIDPMITYCGVDADYLETFNMKMTEGVFYREELAESYEKKIVINERLAEIMGMESVIGRRLSQGEDNYSIIGVMKDFHFKPVSRRIGPLMLLYEPKLESHNYHIFVKIDGENVAEALADMEIPWKQYCPDYPFEYNFLDDDFERMYSGSKNMGNILRAFAVLAIIISCMGLLGLAAFMAEQKTKEIGIRKVMGASVTNIVRLLSNEFLFLVLISNVLAWPLAWVLMSGWLQSFAYRTTLAFWIFIMASLSVLAFALLTVGIQAIKAATANPVKSLRYE